jgi:transposase
MLKPVESYDGIYLACGFTDLRKSVDGLAAMVKHDFGLDPFENSLFLFCNKGRNRLKCLNWDTNGFILYYKRLDGHGAKFMWPREQQDVRDITSLQLRKLLDGFSVDPPKGFEPVTAREFC